MQNQIKGMWRKAESNDWLSVVMIGLLGFMAWLSYDFVSGMLPPEMGILSVGGLIGLGLGAVLWERAYHTAKSEPQEELAKIMVWVNLSGEGLAFLGEVLRTGRVVGVEALARFQLEPRRGPDKWFDEAWAIGRGVELELAAVRTALRAFETLPQEVFLAVNVAPRTILDPALAEALREAPGARLVLEMTEHARVEDYGPLLTALAPLRARGVRLSIDDAGAGFASMQHILRLRPDFIKLDLVLTRDIDTDPTRRALTAALVAFGHDVGALILAEGIETRCELIALQRLGVAFGQGYHLARPMPLPAPAWIDVGTLSRRPEALRVSMSPDPVI